MCDTFIILPEFTKNDKLLFGKNSDREPDEVQNVIFIKGRKHDSLEKEKCTYLTLPQAEETYDTILFQPFWMFGGEMGVNQFGLVIGNEAVFTTEPLSDKGLLGMDMIRLALTRKKTAKEALDYIIYLLETYGQGGSCGYHNKKMNYHNSWLIGDPNEAYVLETAGKYWVWKKVESHYSISNVLTIEDDYDEVSEGAIENAIKMGRCKSKEDFSFRKAYIARGLNMIALENRGAKGDERISFHYGRIEKIIKEKEAGTGEGVDLFDMMEILRHHHKEKDGIYYPGKDGSMEDICMHSKISLLRPSQSVNSLIVESGKDLTRIFTTFGSAPCIQLYRPLFLYPNLENDKNAENLDINQELDGCIPGKETYTENSAWWRLERFHRIVLKDYVNRTKIYKAERDETEKRFVNEFMKIDPKDINSLKEFVKKSFKESEELLKKWADKIKEFSHENPNMKSAENKSFLKKWDKISRENKIPDLF
ncbi:MAG: carcinine hydrolase/isopenicillin-N N-acyltransferase family protein [Promethearchaeota archaeon]